jgi:hypothetical protein
MNFSMARRAEDNQIFGSIIAQSGSRQKVMDLKIFHGSAGLASPAISLQDFTAELAIGFWIEPQAGPFGADPGQSVAWTFSRSWLIRGFGRLMTSRVRQGNNASWLPASRLTPARKSAQIISKQ